MASLFEAIWFNIFEHFLAADFKKMLLGSISTYFGIVEINS